MTRTNVLKILGVTSGSLLLLIGFQNCGQTLGDGFQIDTKSVQLNSQFGDDTLIPQDPGDDDDDTSEDQSTGDLCEDQLYAKFVSGYYAFLKKNCAGCHGGAVEAAPPFAAKDSLASYKVFQDKGYLTVSNNAVNPNHQTGITGPQNSAAIDSLKTDWVAAQATWLQCKGTDSEDKSVLTIGKANSAIVTNKSDASYWGSLAWNMNTAADMTANSVKYPLNVSIEVQVAKVSGNEVGYAVRNPTMSMASGTAKYRVKSLFFYLNGKLLDSATVYRNINAVICAGTPLNLAPVGNAQLIVLATGQTVKATDKFSVQFSSIEKVDPSTTCGTGSTGPTLPDDTPAKVTFTQLVSNDAKLGVFKSQCFTCHTGSGAQAGLDLSNYTQAKNSAAKILTRINDAGSPMPRSGLMSSQMRAIVEKWVTIGTPQN